MPSHVGPSGRWRKSHHP